MIYSVDEKNKLVLLFSGCDQADTEPFAQKGYRVVTLTYGTEHPRKSTLSIIRNHLCQ